MKTNARSLLKAAGCAGALLLTASASLGAPPDFSVKGTTDFLSDIPATLAAQDANKDGKLDSTELGSRSWMLGFMDRNRDGGLDEAELKAGMAKLSRQLFNSRNAAPSTSAPPPFQPAADPRRSPRPLKAAEWAVDTRIPDLEVLTLSGERKKLHSLTGKKGTALAMLSPDCPVSRRWFPELQRLEKEYSAKGIAFLFLAAPGEKDTAALQAIGMTGAILTDPDGQFLRALKATQTTDVFLLDAAKTLIYRGAVDDQYGTGYSRPAPEQRYLAAGLECLLTGTRPATAATEAPGCELELPAAPEKPAPSAPVTWHNRISRMVQAHCAACHHDGGAGPFSLETYAHMIKKAKTVRRVVADAVMPPWSAAPSPDPAHTAWQNESTLPAADKAALLAWLDGDRAEGDPAEAPLPPVLKKEAALGSPDLVLQLPAPIQIQAEGTMPYQSVFVNTGLKEDKWVSAWDVLPTASQVVHHVLIYVYPPGDELPGTAERRGHLASWVPGQGPALYPAGYAKALPAGSRLRFEIHYTPNGKPAEDRMRLALKFAPAPPDYAVESAGVADVLLDIPPGAASHPEAAEWTAPADIRVLSLSPHMHVRGKAMRFEVTAPHSEPRTLLEVPRYDFNWQIPVKYAEPPLLPKGSVIKVTGWFDNSSANPANPDPKATVHWGSQTNDEMMIGYVEYCRSLLPAQGRKETRGPSLTGETER